MQNNYENTAAPQGPTENMILKLTLDLPEEQSYLRITRLLGRTLLEHLHTDDQDVDEIELVVGELCANVVRHAHSTDHRFAVVLEYYAEKIVVTVQDKGEGFHIADVAPVGSERADFMGQPDRIGGYGLQLVELMSDRLTFYKTDPQGTTVRAEKSIRYKTPADAEAAETLAGLGGARVEMTVGTHAVPTEDAGTPSAMDPTS